MQWEVTIWTHDGIQVEIISDGAETIDELIHRAKFKAQDVNGIEIKPYLEKCRASKKGN